MSRRVVRIIAAGSVVAAMIACGGGSNSDTTGPTPVFTSVVITPASPTVFVGSTQAMVATGKDQTGAVMNGLPAATWASSDPSKATIDANTGVATGVAAGTTTITGTIVSGSITHSGTTELTVTVPSSTASVAATPSLVFSPNNVTVVRAGGTATITWHFQSVAHNVTFDSEPSGASVDDIPTTMNTAVARDFTVAGRYAYHCTIHGSGMSGVINVQ